MAGTRIFDVSIVSGTSHSLYTIYYDVVGPSNIATIFQTSNPATGVTYNDLTSVNGVRVTVPQSALKILLYNDSCLVDDEIILPTPTPSPSPTPSSTPTPTPTPTPNCDFGVDIIVTTPTPTPSPTSTPTPTPTPSSTPTPTPTPNCGFDVDVIVTTPTPTPSPTSTPTPTPSPSPSPTPTPSPSPSPTSTPTPTPSPTSTPTPTPSPSPTPSPTPTPNCGFDVDISINQAPTGFTPTLLSQSEGTATGTTITTFSAGDPDTSNTHTFSLVSGTGDTDNASFTLSSSGVLKNAIVFDRETKSSYSIRVRVTDQGGLYFEDTRIVTVLNVNETPYGLTLSNNTINENAATGTTIGTFTGLDYDANDTFTYSLIDPGGNSDESKFTIGSTTGILKNSAVFNYEVKNSYTITVRVTDNAGSYYEDDFVISVNDVNEAPTAINLSSSTILENQPTGTTVGTFTATDPDATETHTFTLVSGVGDTNNSSFNLTTGGTLTSAEVFDRETKSSYSIRVRVKDKGNLTLESVFVITVTNQNEAPYGLSLSNNTINENAATGTTIGTFTALDNDSGDTFTYSLVGTGNDNNSFTLTSVSQTAAVLKSKEIFNYEVKNSYTIEVEVTDAGGLTYSDTFDISVLNVNETPTNIGLSSSSVAENSTSGTTVGTFTTTDPDAGGSFTYTLVTGTGSNDNTSFIIDGTTLKTATVFDYETKNSYSIRVRSTDQGGLWVEKVITISITNVNERPGEISPTTVSFAENQPTGTTITTFSSTDPDANTTLTWSFVSGVGDTDNDTFNITTGGTLTSTIVHNYEVKNSYSIRIRVSDGALTRDAVVTVNITNVNETPTDIALSNSTVPENSSTGTTVGTLTTVDPDANNTFTYTLVSGTGDTDNDSFFITGISQTAAVLKTNEVFNFETKSSYSIRVQSQDQGGLTRQEAFTITVTNINETPTNIALSNSSIDENTPTGSTVGTLSTTDPDSSNTFTYTLVTGTSSENNDSFYIDGNVLKSNQVFDYETKSTYKCRVRSTDQGGLWFEKAFTIFITNITVSGGVSVTNASCYGETGTITVTGTTGGGAPYTYSLDAINYQTSTTFTRAAGNYTVFIKDSNGEIGAVFATITQPTELLFSVQEFTLPNCNGDEDGSIIVTASGGVAPYQYSINGGVLQTGTTFSSLSNGTYTLRVSDANGCTKTTTQTLNRTVITSTITVTNIDCNGDADGIISVGTPSGGTGTGYQIKLGSSGTYETVTTWPKVYSPLNVGTYHIYIKDSNECEYLFTRVITQPSVLDVVENSKTYPTCWNSTNGALSVTASGGTSPYTYSLDDVTYQLSSSFTGLTQGIYTVRVKDTKGCKDTVSVDIRRSPVAATIAITNVTCNGYNNGSISVTNGTGGTGSGYQVKIDDAEYTTIPKSFTGLIAGSYTITVKDSNGCETVYSDRTVTQPNAISVTTTFTNPTCSGDTNGQITVSATGGNGSYEYSIDGGDYQTSNQFTTLGTGTYTLSVRDGNGCLGSTTRTLTKTQVGSSISVTGVTCNGGSNGRVSAGTPYGGNGPTYQYKWNNGSWTTFNSTVTFTNLPAGTYPFEVKDVSGCTTTYSVGVSQPSAVNVTVSSSSAPTCYNGENGSVTLSATGGTGTKLYSLDGVNYYASGTFTGLSTGSYVGYAKDANNCVDTVSFSLTKTSPTATVTQTNIACNGDGNGTITVSNPTGGNGGGTFSNYDVKLNSGSWISFSSTSYTFTGLSGGVHTIYIRDNSDCVSNGIGVYITEPSALNASYSSATPPTCDGGDNGSIQWTRSGGTSPYLYEMNGSEITSLLQTGLTEGTYTLVVYDNNGCSDSVSVTLSKGPVTLSTTITNPTCNGGTGSIRVDSIAGGNGGTGYRHRLNNGSWFTTIPYTYSSLSAASYTIYVEDYLGCQNSYTRTVTQPSAVTFTTSPSNPTCWNGSDGSITFNPSGGSAPYQYTINGGTNWLTGSTFSGLSVGTYSVRVKDSNGCLSTLSSVTLSRTAPSASFSTSNVSCYQGADGSITVSNPTGGYGGATQSYQHKLNNGTYVNFQSTSYTYTNKEAGDYTVWIKDFSGCEKSYSVTVSGPTQLTASITSYTTGPNGSITVTSGGGTWNKTYRLYRDTTSPYTVGGGTLVATIAGVTSANPSQTFTNLAEGYYYVIVTDANGCTASTAIQNTFTPTCTYYEILYPSNATNATGTWYYTCCDGSSGSIILSRDQGGFICVLDGTTVTTPPGGSTQATLGVCTGCGDGSSG